MFEGLKYRYRLCKHRHSKRKTEKLYAFHIKNAKDEKEKNRVISEAMFMVGEEDRNIRELQTEHLCNIAKALIIPIDSQDESLWDKGESCSSNSYSKRYL